MSEVTIVGNGPSRLGEDLSAIHHEVWGCNAIYRDTDKCDIVFAVDMPVQKEIVGTELHSQISTHYQLKC